MHQIQILNSDHEVLYVLRLRDLAEAAAVAAAFDALSGIYTICSWGGHVYMLAQCDGLFTEAEIEEGIAVENAERESLGLPLRTAEEVWQDFYEVEPDGAGGWRAVE